MLHDEREKLVHVEEFGVPQAGRAVGLVAVHAGEAVLERRDHGLAAEALGRLVGLVRLDHAVALSVQVTVFELHYALVLHAEAESLLASAQHHQVFGQVVHDIELVGLEARNKHVFEALVVVEFCSVEVFVTDLALDHDLRTLSFDVLEQFSSSQVLEVLVIADVATELWAVVHGMLLQLLHSLPDYLSTLGLKAFVRELAEVNAIPQYLVDFLHEISSGLAVRAADIVPWSGSRALLLRALAFVASILLSSISSLQLYLAVLAEQLIALLTFHWLIRKVVAHDALDLFDHLALQLILDLGHLDVELRNWLWAHDSLDCLIGDEEFVVHLITLGSMQSHAHLLALIVLLLVSHVVELLMSVRVVVMVLHRLGLTLAWRHVVVVMRVLSVTMLVHYILYYN